MACKIQTVDLGGKHEFMFECVDRRGERLAGIRAVRRKVAGRMRYVVRGVMVLEGNRRQGLATKLYESAAAEACKRRAPLASDERVGDISREFWAKQLRKGRATVLSKRGGSEKGEKAPVYSLSCPAPRSLSGPRRRRR